jgi:RNA-directed DNA polymerase
MKESYEEDPTSHLDPESCAGLRKGTGEALTGANTGEVLNPEIKWSGLPTSLSETEGNTAADETVSPRPSPRGRRPSACVETSGMGTGRSPRPPSVQPVERATKVSGQTVAMNEVGKSDESVVSEKPSNEDLPLWVWAKEEAERRDSAKRNSAREGTPRTQCRKHGAIPVLDWVHEKAKKDRKVRFTSLFHHLELSRLRRCFMRLHPKAAPGVDRLGWKEYDTQRDERLQSLHRRVLEGKYRGLPSRRVYIPKPDGRQRPLGVAALEDKIVQSAVVEILNAIYENDFLGFSYGFRPGRSPHRALDAWATALHERNVRWVLDADIRGFYDTISHEWLMRFLQHRIADPRILRLIQQWLKAGVLEDKEWKPTEEGTPQGATISPLLANVYLHYVFDLWADHWRKHGATGEVVIVRYADDIVMGFSHREDAQRFLDEMRKRMEKFQLALHPEKTRIVRFGPFAREDCRKYGEGKPGTFAFLGFTHISARTHRGKFLLMRTTVAKRQRAKLHEIAQQLRTRCHDPIPEQGAWLRQVLNGYYNYHAVPTNSRALGAFRRDVTRSWCRALRRRSQRHRLPWSRMQKLCARWLPANRIRHPWPQERFHATTQGKSRVR